jgi:hypothetical protein
VSIPRERLDPSRFGLWANDEGRLVHPDAPSGGGGPGGFRNAFSLGQLLDFGHDFPHPHSAVGRRLDHADLDNHLEKNSAATGSTTGLLDGPFISTNYAQTTVSVGDGFCVPLIQKLTGAPVTSDWRAGNALKDKPSLKEGTAIATFNAKGQYESKARGNHAAIFVRYEKQDAHEGVLIFDQYREWAKDPKYGEHWNEKQSGETDADFKKRTDEVAQQYPEVDDKGRRFRRKQPGVRFIAFDAKSKNPSNNASAYSVLLSLPKPDKSMKPKGH